MPKRSNDFQRFIALLHRRFADVKGTKVVESAMLPDVASGIDREVDIVIETDVGGYPIRVCIECCASRRSASIEWVDRMCGKHQTLPTSKLVLIAERGFSKAARSKAMLWQVDCVDLRHAGGADWPAFVAKHRAMRMQLAKARLVSPRIIYFDETGKKQQVDVGHDDIIHFSRPLGDHLARRLLDRSLQQMENAVLDNTPTPGEYDFWFDFEVTGFGASFVMLDGSEVRVFSLRAGVKAKSETQPLETTAYMFKDTPVVFAKAKFSETDLHVVIAEPPGQVPNIQMQETPRTPKRSKRHSRPQDVTSGHSISESLLTDPSNRAESSGTENPEVHPAPPGDQEAD